MGSASGTEGVLITGTYGSGKSSVAAEIADVLERRGDRYAYLDLDFLAWGHPGGGEEAERRMLRRNVRAVAANYRAAGVRRFVLAGFVADGTGLEDLRGALDVPIRVVRLTLPLQEIERRLARDVTTGRRDDLRRAESQSAILEDAGIEDLAVANDRPLREVAVEILGWLGWAEPT